MFPTISNDAVLKTATEFVTGTENERKDKIVAEFCRVFEENPAIGEYLARVIKIKTVSDTPYLTLHSVGFGLQMYRILEEEFKLRGMTMPLVAPETGAPIQEEFFRSFEDFMQKMLELMNEAPKIASVATDWTFDFFVQDDTRSSQIVYAVGLCVYRFIKSQWEADELQAKIGHKLT